MVEDARFEDGGETPLNLKALDAEDLQVISTLAQDAVFPVTEIRWDKTGRRFAVLLNRFRWEDVPAAQRRGRNFERVQSVLMFEDVIRVQSQGVDPTEEDTVLSLLAMEFEPGEDGTGRITLVLAGDGAVGIDVETIDVTLKDVTRPYIAPSRKQPDHA